LTALHGHCTGFEPISPTPERELEAVLQQLEAKKEEWANLTTLKRATLLRDTLKCVIEARVACPAGAAPHAGAA
jgi:hypothetical protein